MILALARCLDDPHALWDELQAHWRHGCLVGLAPLQEHEALQKAVLGARSVRPGPAMQRADPLAAAGHLQDGEGAEPGKRQDAAAVAQETWGAALVLGSGGSSGGRRWCLQPLSHLQASAEACAVWLSSQGVDPGRCLHLNALPLHHVSGLMPLLRSRCWGAELRWLPPNQLRQPDQLPQSCPLPADRPVLLSLVPTQLQRLMDVPAAVPWLRRCAVIWVGGAALPADLAARARAQGLALAPCYGATETAAMVCALPPQHFLAGEPGCGPALADVELRLEGAQQAIAVRTPRLSPGWFETGQLRRFSDAQGWWRSGDAGVWQPAEAGRADAATGGAHERTQPDRSASSPRDAGGEERTGATAAASAEVDRNGARDGTPPDPEPMEAARQGPGPATGVRSARAPWASLVILGRLDGAIHSGGETVFPDQVRQRLLKLIREEDLPVADLLLLAESDAVWGERLVALVRWQTIEAIEATEASDGREAGGSSTRQTAWLRRLADLARTLPPPQRPRRWLPCPELEPTITGKWERQRWRTWLETHEDREA